MVEQSADSRPRSFLSRATLAWELDIAESTVDDFVRRGILPPPVKLTNGCVRWDWDMVKMAVRSLPAPPPPGAAGDTGDPYDAGVKKLGEILDDGKKKRAKA